jgi:PEP-CTERM motif
MCFARNGAAKLGSVGDRFMVRAGLLLMPTVEMALAGTPAPAHATTYNAAFSVTAWTGPCFNGLFHTCSSTDASQQALPSYPLISSSDKVGSFSFTGPLDLDVSNQAANTYGDLFQPKADISNFVGANGNTLATFLSKVISTGSYGFEFTGQTTSIMELTFTTGSALSGTIDHDDGISLYSHGNTTTDLLPLSAAAPTAAELTNFSIGPGTYDLYYVEANGAPAILDMEVVAAAPEPASLAMLGVGILGLGFVRRRKIA